eukprot:148988-Chlamydomonas_euryale.AAC.1
MPPPHPTPPHPCHPTPPHPCHPTPTPMPPNPTPMSPNLHTHATQPPHPCHPTSSTHATPQPAPHAPRSYDPDAVAEYFRRRPVAVAQRAAQVVVEMAGFGAALALDFATGRVQANEKARAVQLRGAIERLGPAFVKVAQVKSVDV